MNDALAQDIVKELRDLCPPSAPMRQIAGIE